MTNIIPFPKRENHNVHPSLHNFEWLNLLQSEQEKSITICQAIFFKLILTTGDVNQIGTIEEIERLQNIKLQWRLWYNNDLLSIPLSEIAPGSQVENIMRTLENIGAKSSVFHRYAWRWKLQRIETWWKSLLPTQTCCI